MGAVRPHCGHYESEFSPQADRSPLTEIRPPVNFTVSFPSPVDHGSVESLTRDSGVGGVGHVTSTHA